MAPSAVDEPAEAAEAAVAAVWAGLHVSAISLRRRADRWAACEAHLTSVLPPAVRGRLKMVEGTDAAAAVGGASPGEASVAAFELATGSVVYRGWPLVEVADARRCFPSMPASATDAEAWIFYESACRRAWRPDRARLYVDFFHRHLTAGDVGAGLSHLRVAEATHAEGVPWQLVLEDDARLTPHAVPALLDEIALLSVLNVAWDIIYLHSADYGRHPEPRVHPRSRLLVAGHRKVSRVPAPIPAPPFTALRATKRSSHLSASHRSATPTRSLPRAPPRSRARVCAHSLWGEARNVGENRLRRSFLGSEGMRGYCQISWVLCPGLDPAQRPYQRLRPNSRCVSNLALGRAFLTCRCLMGHHLAAPRPHRLPPVPLCVRRLPSRAPRGPPARRHRGAAVRPPRAWRGRVQRRGRVRWGWARRRCCEYRWRSERRRCPQQMRRAERRCC